ncbi:MAG: efflux RND transporter periplasmic adaptor subunit [Coriobacteriia bacterium]|nr:efflux RND transporter periplasmic adaptor subunit [Coriobacteriia bacterium]MBN2847424.1 efflux RND transporter periplasmic adaptor subunit [Coriobacteriia bacterium]
MSLSNGIKRHKGWIALAGLVVLAATSYLLVRDGGDAEAGTTYQTETASLGTLSVTAAGTGNLEVDGTTDVYPAVAGTVATIAVAEGTAVETGTVLFTLDAASAESNTAKAFATLRQSEQSVAQAQLQVTRAQSTLEAVVARAQEPTPTASAADIDVAEGDVAVAKAQLASAQAQLTTSELAYDDSRAAEDDLAVIAPCSGIVYALEIAEGDSVSPGASSGATTTSGAAGGSTATSAASSAPVVIAPAQPLAVHLTVNEVDLPSLALGQRADIEFDAFPDLTATGKVYEIADSGSNSNGVVTFDVWLSIDVADPRLRSGMSAAATVVTEVARDTLIVSNSAVQSDGDGGYYVQVLDSGSTEPRRVTVETGLASSTQTQVLSGLSEGDTVVTQTLDSTDDTSSGSGLMMPGMGGGPRG